ncbi:hypothetical protein Ancab_002848 [Ancistrocladus abbreviatus]
MNKTAQRIPPKLSHDDLLFICREIIHIYAISRRTSLVRVTCCNGTSRYLQGRELYTGTRFAQFPGKSLADAPPFGLCLTINLRQHSGIRRINCTTFQCNFVTEQTKPEEKAGKNL